MESSLSDRVAWLLRLSFKVYAGSAVIGITTLLAILAGLLLLHPSLQTQPIRVPGCSRVGRRGPSHLVDEHDPKYAGESEQKDHSKAAGLVKSIFLYPVKSCQGIEVDAATITATGFEHDRIFCFAQLHSPFPVSVTDSDETRSAHKWRFITQRDFRRMSQIHIELWIPDPSRPEYRPDLADVQTKGALIISFPFTADGAMGTLTSWAAKLRRTVPTHSFKVPLQPTEAQSRRDFTEEPVTVWKDTVPALNMESILPPELQYAVGVRNPLTLFRLTQPRDIFRTAPRKEQLGWQPQVGFGDYFPINMLGVASMQKLSRTQPTGSPPLSIRRFRPNVVMAGPAPYAEDEWKRIRIGDEMEFHVACRCVRCRLPNIDPATGERHRQEPYKTLVTHRDVDKGAPGMGCLGVNLVPAEPTGIVRVGDSIAVLERGDLTYEPLLAK